MLFKQMQKRTRVQIKDTRWMCESDLSNLTVCMKEIRLGLGLGFLFKFAHRFTSLIDIILQYT